jgi:hypothetical protein
MHDPLEISLKNALDKMRERGLIPLGVISYCTERDAVVISLIAGTDREEAQAIFAEAGIAMQIKGTPK